ncbi:MAG: hypothetical protein AAB638_03720 [Patescibacteria group bacterium]
MIKKYSIGALLLVALLAYPLLSIAEEPEPTHGSIKQIREQFKSNVKDIKTENKVLKDIAKENLKTAREEFQEKKKEFEGDVKEKRKEVETRMKAQKAELTTKLRAVKDERKREIVQKLYTDLDALNKRILEHYTQALDKLEGVLVRIEERADKSAPQVGDTSLVQQDIVSAREAIAKARAAIVTQSGTTYAISVTTEAELKNAVSRAREALRTDLGIVKIAVKTAGEAVRKASVDLAQLPRTSSSPTPTP